MVTLDRLQHRSEIDFEAKTVTVAAGTTLSELNDLLAHSGLAMCNLGDITYQTVAGAVSTGTHGTGLDHGGLATQLRALRLITADGAAVDCNAATNPELFDSARISLGGLGIITKATIAVEPAFHLHAVEEPRPIDEVLEGWPDLVEGNDHFEFYWIPGTRLALTKTNRRTLDPRRPLSTTVRIRDKIIGENLAFGALCQVARRRPQLVPRLVTLITSAPSRLEYIDHSHKVFASPRWVRFAEMEYSVPLDRMATAVRQIAEGVRRTGIDLMFPIEVRAAAADDIPLSTGHGRQSAYIAVHRAAGRPYREYFELVEAICSEHEGRPHWGKIHFQSAATLCDRYPRWSEFQAVRHQVDPNRVFTNEYLDRVLGVP